MPAVPWVSTQAGPTTITAFLKAVYLSWPAIRRSRAAKVSCIESEKLITMISGVITFRNILRLKLAHPSPPSASTIAMIGGNAATIMNDILRKKMIAMMQPATNTEDIVGQPVALDRVADFELHDRNAGQFDV